MCLVPDTLDEEECLRSSWQNNRPGLLWLENLLELLGEADHGNLIDQVKLLEYLDGDAQLSLAAVNDQQIGQEAPGLVFALLAGRTHRVVDGLHVAPEASGQRFAH